MEDRKIYAKHNIIRFENNCGNIFTNKLSDCNIEVGDEGDAYVIRFRGKHTYVLSNDWFGYSEEEIQKMLEHDWVYLDQDEDDFVGFAIDNKKMEEELEWGIAQIKQGNIKTRAFNSLISKLRTYEELWSKQDSGVHGYFSTLYNIKYGLSPSVIVFINNERYIALKERLSVVGTNIFWGNDIRVSICGLNNNEDFVNKWFYFTLDSSEEKKKLIEASTNKKFKILSFQMEGKKWKVSIE